MLVRNITRPCDGGPLAAGGELPVDLIGKGGFPFNDSPGINFILEQREFVRHLLSSFGVVPRVWVC